MLKSSMDKYLMRTSRLEFRAKIYNLLRKCVTFKILVITRLPGSDILDTASDEGFTGNLSGEYHPEE